VVVRYQGARTPGIRWWWRGEDRAAPGAKRHPAPGKKCIIGNGVVVDPEALLEEIDLLRSRGLLADPTQLVVSENAHVILPYHKRIDAVARSRRRSAPPAAASGPATRTRWRAAGSGCATCSRKARSGPSWKSG